MALSFEQLKAAFQNRSQPQGNTGFWDKFYPFYKMNYDQIATVRFLPDLDEENPLGFLVENRYHELMVNGQKKRVACLRMYGEACPCCELSSAHYDKGDAATGKVFYRKIDYIGQVLVLESPFEYPIKPEENPVRLISISPKIYQRIESAFTRGDLDTNPVDLLNGYNFRIIKTKQGEWANYDSSDFARKSSPVPDDLIGRISLYDIKNFRFTKVERDAMEAMINAHLTGAKYGEEQQAAAGSLKPGVSADAVMAALNQAQAAPAPQAAPTVAPVQQAAPAPTPAPAPAPAAQAGEGKKMTAQEVLAMIRNRPQA